VTEEGYFVLAQIKDGVGSRRFEIRDKLSYLSNGQSLTGFHRLRELSLGQSTVFVDYIDVLDLFKASSDSQQFASKLNKLLVEKSHSSPCTVTPAR
jgi:hypothetical protein